jgi:acylphosphatase
METVERVHIMVKGRVQGVGFRAYVQQQAVQLKLAGWVRNVGWSQVESVAEGPRAGLENFIEAARRGPSVSRVEECSVAWQAGSGEFASFEIRSSR